MGFLLYAVMVDSGFIFYLDLHYNRSVLSNSIATHYMLQCPWEDKCRIMENFQEMGYHLPRWNTNRSSFQGKRTLKRRWVSKWRWLQGTQTEENRLLHKVKEELWSASFQRRDWLPYLHVRIYNWWGCDLAKMQHKAYLSWRVPSTVPQSR